MKNLTIKLTFILTLLVLMVGVNFGQQVVVNFQTAPALTQEDVRELVEKYRNMNAEDLRAQLAKVKPDQEKKKAIDGLPDNWKANFRTVAQVADPRLWLVGEKAVKISGSSIYEILYLDNQAPVAASDSNCLLIITSGMLRLTENDEDALIGVILHEEAHGLMVERSVSAKMAFNRALAAKDYLAADKQRVELARIELECDLIAAKLLKESNRSLDGYARLQSLLEASERQLNIVPAVQFHPDSTVRSSALLTLKSDPSSAAVATK